MESYDTEQQTDGGSTGCGCIVQIVYSRVYVCV